MKIAKNATKMWHFLGFWGFKNGKIILCDILSLYLHSGQRCILYVFVLKKCEIGSKWNENGVELELEWNCIRIGVELAGFLLRLRATDTAVPEWP